jgi:hypothetical protein
VLASARRQARCSGQTVDRLTHLLNALAHTYDWLT